jgi:acyl-CoA synthetase (AMP-forming)/AMP-acid ligase II
MTGDAHQANFPRQESAAPGKIPASFNITDHFLYVPALAHPGRPAILGEPAPVSYGELASLTRRVSLALSREGIAPGERVLIVLPDSAEFIAAFLAVVAIGAVAVPVNSIAREADYAHYLRDSGVRLAIVHETTLDEFLPATQGLRPSSIVIVTEDPIRAGSIAAPASALRLHKWLPASA